MNDPDYLAGQIGIFWFVRWKADLRLLAASCPVSDGEPYGDMMTYGTGHYTTWDRWRRSRTARLERVIANAFEYEEWPRGRVSFDMIRNGPLLLCDSQIMKSDLIEIVLSRFNVSSHKLTLDKDAHYKSTEDIEAV
ncbi:hypothetical protein FJ942_26325 [Mesorhizobium sp. B2-4-2]|uniref:hypothetical protein n=1 Tax=Mesorhizobium sp. B2-4-2 TaxID=2589947 RepID=UPI00112E2EAE|nr:hypothetical protein [Mesorhizobium sp. B2-4-2]TPL48677.1 hypothetical protein FJ942_26325 [Mesorhizobium sp. B2-4-2]